MVEPGSLTAVMCMKKRWASPFSSEYYGLHIPEALLDHALCLSLGVLRRVPKILHDPEYHLRGNYGTMA